MAVKVWGLIGQSAENDYLMFSPKRDIFIMTVAMPPHTHRVTNIHKRTHTHTHKVGEHHRRGSTKNIKARGWEKCYETVFWTGHGYCTQKLPATVVT